MRSFFLLVSSLLMLTSFGFYTTTNNAAQYKIVPTPTPTQEQVLFDDFNYEAYDDPALSENGWVVRAGEGWPGVPGAIWRAENVTFVNDFENQDNRLMQLTSSTDGDKTYQTQVCQQRKFYEGTYATRVHFSDVPATGPDGDNVVQTFYLISPQEYDMAPDYSELDFEYLPNGGWGLSGHTFHATTWETFQLEPWIADNINDHRWASFGGWHTLVLQIMDGTATYYVDGEEFATHEGTYYPEVPMSINYNLWFIQDGQIRSTDLREYVEQVDWMYFAANVALTPDEIETRVAALREDGTTFTDTVPEWTPPLETPCNF